MYNVKSTFTIWLCVLFSVLFLACSQSTPYFQTSSKNSYLYIDSTYSDKSSISSLINPYREKLEKEMNVILSYSPVPLVKQKPGSELTNYLADAVLNEAQHLYKDTIDFCLLNYGGIRASLPKGEITKGHIFELMPFENEIVILTISPDNLAKLLTYLAATGGHPVSGLSMEIENGIAKNCYINNLPIKYLRSYTVVTSDYLALGGDNMDFFLNPLDSTYLGVKIRDVLMKKIKESDTIILNSTKRISVIK